MKRALLLASLVLASMRMAYSSIDQENFGYLATTDVSSILNLALDVKAMRATSNITQKENIYQNGQNSKPLTLASLSLQPKESWTSHMQFNLYTAFFEKLGKDVEEDRDGNFDGTPVSQYAHTLVDDLFRLNATHIEGEGAVIYNVLMAFWGSLFDLLSACRDNNGDTTASMITALDEAAAYWVGADQEREDNQSGFFLYSIAENAGFRFGQDNGVSRVNTLIMQMFNFIQADIEKGVCSSGESGYQTVREKVKKVVAFSNVVLVQQLLYHIVNAAAIGTSDFVELYALALLPQVAACKTSAYETLLELLVNSDITSETQDRAIATLQSSYSCLQISCSDVGAYDNARVPECNDAPNAGLPQLASYVPTADVRQKSYIDRDVRYIRLLLSQDATDAALDVYKYGWNAYFSLSDLAQNRFSPETASVFDSFFEYYNSNNSTYIDTLVVQAINGEGAFADATKVQKSEAVISILQDVVLYLSSLTELQAALEACNNGLETDTLMGLWDGGVSFYIGSTEGSINGGEDEGESLYGRAKAYCGMFSTCENNNAAVNEILVQSFTVGSGGLLNGNCAEVKVVLESVIESYMPVVPIQGAVLSKITASAADIDSAAQSSMFVASQALLPAFNDVDVINTSILQNHTTFRDGSKNTEDSVNVVIDTISKLLTKSSVDCSSIGQITYKKERHNFCDDKQNVPALSPTPSPQKANSTDAPMQMSSSSNLAWNRYNFDYENIAVSYSMLSLDVKTMYNAASSSDAQKAYSFGRNSTFLATHPNIKTLSQTSTEAASFMSDDPMFNFYRVALYDDSSFDNSTVAQGWPYADAVVRLALSPNNGDSAALGAETSVVMNCWMLLVNLLYESTRQCTTSHVDATTSIDAAVGLWIGQDQAQAVYNSGYMLYSLAQDAAQDFGLPEGEAQVNTDLMFKFNEAQKLAKSCEDDGEAFFDLRVKVDEIIRLLTIPLLQKLLYSLSVKDQDRTELYSLAFVPQSISCNEGEFDYIRDALFEGFKGDESDEALLLSNLGVVLGCLRISCSDIGALDESNTELQAIVGTLCNDLEVENNPSLIASYKTSFDVHELSRIDLDLHQIRILMRANALQPALDIYQYGRNSFGFFGVDAGQLLSLRDLARDPKRVVAADVFDTFSTFYGSKFYVDDFVMSILYSDNPGNFTDASRLQKAEAVFRTIQTSLSYMSVLSRLGAAVAECEKEGKGQLQVDEAVALFAGSMEGTQSGGSEKHDGALIMALGKEVCETFGTCETHGDSSRNTDLIFAFSDMKEQLDENDCSAAQIIMTDTIQTLMAVSLIQGTLKYAFENQHFAAGSDDPRIAVGAAIAAAVLPEVNYVNETSAAIIQDNLNFSYNTKPVADGAEVVFAAMKSVLRGMDIDCEQVGTHVSVNTDFCDNDAVAPLPETTVVLGETLYTSSTYIQDRANIALDVKQMVDALTGGRKELAQFIYSGGENSPIYDKDGVQIGERSLGKFSTNAEVSMRVNPLYQTAVFALRDEKDLYLGANAYSYADSVVNEAFSVGGTTTLASEAAVILNLWMEIVNELYTTVDLCKANKISDEDGIQSFDEAAAYWIGDGQVAGNHTRGHLLYALSERLADLFDTADGSGQATINTKVLMLFHQAKIELSYPAACSDGSMTAQRLHEITGKIVSQMIALSIQGLRDALYSEDRARVRVYAHAYVPFVRSCSPKAFDYLQSKLLTGDYRESEVQTILMAISSSMYCFNVNCADIGTHKLAVDTECTDPSGFSSLAGYHPLTDIQDIAKIDIDVQEIDVLIQMGAYEAAENIYQYGSHALTGLDNGNSALSLAYLATTSGRSKVPQFDAYKRYFGGDDHYADTLVREALDPKSPHTQIQRWHIAVRASQYMILYMSALQAMHEAISICGNANARNEAAATTYWDTAAAFLIGRMEGSFEGGSSDGKLFWSLSKEYCDEFGTCSTLVENSSSNNDALLSLLYAGRGAIASASCNELKKVVREISPILHTSLYQAALSTSRKYSNTALSKLVLRENLLAESHMYSLAVLPLAADANREAATTIEQQTALIENPFKESFPALVEAYAKVMQKLGIDCEDVGRTSYVDPCTGYTEEKNGVGLAWILVIVIVAVSIVSLVAAILIRRRTKSKLENQPVFYPPKGELNYAGECCSPSRACHPGNDDISALNDASTASDDDDATEAALEERKVEGGGDHAENGHVEAVV